MPTGSGRRPFSAPWRAWPSTGKHPTAHDRQRGGVHGEALRGQRAQVRHAHTCRSSSDCGLGLWENIVLGLFHLQPGGHPVIPHREEAVGSGQGPLPRGTTNRWLRKTALASSPSLTSQLPSQLGESGTRSLGFRAVPRPQPRAIHCACDCASRMFVGALTAEPTSHQEGPHRTGLLRWII